jgi:hypothetical protein
MSPPFDVINKYLYDQYLTLKNMDSQAINGKTNVTLEYIYIYLIYTNVNLCIKVNIDADRVGWEVEGVPFWSPGARLDFMGTGTLFLFNRLNKFFRSIT